MLYWLSKPTKRLIKEIAVGVILYNVVLGAAALPVLNYASYPVIPVLKGLCVGAAAAIMMLVHMAETTERALSSGDPAYAKKATIAQSLIRRLVFLAVIVLCWYVLKADPLAVVIGAMGLKAGAYLQPVLHRISGGKEEPSTDFQDGPFVNGTSVAATGETNPDKTEIS